jgi:hypothetical protein
VTAPGDTYSDRPLLDKLGVKAGMRVALVAFRDAAFEAGLAERGASVVDLSPGLDMVFYRVDRPADLHGIAELRPLIHDGGAIWVLRVKGAARTVRDVDVIDAGRAFDLIDNKIASFSDTLAAMRLVVPLDQRRN